MAEQQHRATARQWRDVKALGYDIATYSCILELLHRIEELEAAAKPNYLEKPDSSLVARVALAITGENGGPINWRPEARAAIREVAAWLSEQKRYGLNTGWVAVRLEEEAKH
jgi:hypothetical protein